MKRNKSLAWIGMLGTVLSGNVAYAEENLPLYALAPLFDKNDSTYDGKPAPQFLKANKEATEKPVWDWPLPFMAQGAINKGFSLPRPFGLASIYTHVAQGIALNELQLGFGGGDLKPINFISLDGATIDTNTWQLKFDAWILPFLNLFTIVGGFKGTGTVPVAIDAGQAFENIAPGYCALHPSECTKMIYATAPMAFHGFNFGGGALIAAGYQNFFFAGTISYVISDPNVTPQNTTTLNIIPRIGYAIRTENSGKIAPYIGANYMDTRITLAGTIVLPLSTSSLGHDVALSYQLKESPLDLWNAVAGVNWEMNDRWTLTFEAGFSQNRDMQILNLNWRI